MPTKEELQTTVTQLEAQLAEAQAAQPENGRAVVAVSAPRRYKEIRHIVRTISAMGGESGAISAPQVNTYIESFLADGWELFNTHYLGFDPNGHNVMWILVR